MNPPSALYGAMNKDRKPFTYTPGGLDLSEIKSERMAKRLMRNAMNQGVPEQPTLHLQSPTTPTTLNVPNFNCLPVQVFPTFPLPANPKSLLKTRNNQQKESCVQDIPYSEELSTNVKQLSSKQCFENNNKNTSMKIESSYDSKDNDHSLPLYEYNTAPIVRSYPCYESGEYVESSPKYDISKNDITGKTIWSQEENQHGYACNPLNIGDNKYLFHTSEPSTKLSSDISKQSLCDMNFSNEKRSQNLEEITGIENNQKEVNVVEKELKPEKDMEEQKSDTNVEAAVTIKLPGKKSAAKTETKVEVVKKVLPDGSTEEVKTTITKTTINGKTEITTKTETTIIPKDDELEEEELVEEEEEEEQDDDANAIVQEEIEEIAESEEKQEEIKTDKVAEESEMQSDSNKHISKQEETSETSITKNVTIVHSSEGQEESEFEEEEEEEENEEEVDKKNKQDNRTKNDISIQKEELETEEADENKIVKVQEPKDEDTSVSNAAEAEEEIEEQEELEETVEESDTKESNCVKQLEDIESKALDVGKQEPTEDNKESIKETLDADSPDNEKPAENITAEDSPSTHENKEEIIIQVQVLKPDLPSTEHSKIEQSSATNDDEIKPTLPPERNIPFREPSVPLEKVEDVEIKPIGQIISKTHTENTEIITTAIDKPTTGLSTQTAYNRIENIVTVNRTTKTLDHAYEQIAPLGIPTVKTYFATPDRITTSPQPSKFYQPSYTPEPQTERRHSLLLDRLSVDRQMPPPEIYQSNYQSGNQTYEQSQWTQEPQSEVLTVSNVKPSTITKNQQWYQQTKKDEVSYNNTPPTQQWSPQPPQTQSLPPTQTHLQYEPQSQTSYIDKQDNFRATLNNSSAYQHSTYPSYTQKPSWVGNNINVTKTPPSLNIQPSQFSYVEKEPADNYQKPPQQFSSSYIPPPWEHESNYVPENLNTTYYQPPPSNKFTGSSTPTWTPTPTSKFTKPKPTSYIPPAPNQSFVKPVTIVDQPKMPGRKTYYSEYERRYISVPESTYIPTENKFQAQPDPSPQYYYDNNEPSEAVEHEWRKELREFSEKTQVEMQTDQTSVKPPWEEDAKYYVPKVTTEYIPTPTWSQTLRPNSWRDRSFESEFGRSKELSRANTLGRGRPQSSYVKSNISAPIPERPRGVSVDRYNPNNYKSPVPSEYPPVQSHTLDPSIGAKTYHNPNVPAYHSRASAEPREQSAAFPQSRQYGEARAPPIQSRSFKYLQWITGTED